MTLGRTPEGAIKIKTDEEGGGLRAVNCACCGGCIKPTATLNQILKNWTSLQVNFTWPAFPPIIPERSGSFNIPNPPGCDPNEGPCPPEVFYNVTVDGIETTFVGAVSVTSEGFIYFELDDTFIGGAVILSCGVAQEGGTPIFIPVNGRNYRADFFSFEEGQPSITITFS